MDHSNLVAKKFFFSQCAHDMCLDHGPEWETIGEERHELNPQFFGLIKTWWFQWCCGKSMARMKVVQVMVCRKCGRTKNHVLRKFLASCLCCGYQFDNWPVRVSWI